jgi:hypothetical protein
MFYSVGFCILNRMSIINLSFQDQEQRWTSNVNKWTGTTLSRKPHHRLTSVNNSRRKKQTQGLADPWENENMNKRKLDMKINLKKIKKKQMKTVLCD